MKYVYSAIMIFVVGTTAFASDFLTSKQKSKSLLTIDNVCGDTWCEGDYDFKFNSIACDSIKRECRIDFSMINRYGTDKVVKVNKVVSAVKTQNSDVACIMGGVSQYSDIMKNERLGELQDNFYENMTECISALEENL